MNGYILINKKAGMTSHDVVNRARKKLNIKKIGHTGTLDPFAEGLLILLIGNATKLAYFFDGLDKKYKGTIQFGTSTDTYDLTGTVLQKKEPALSIYDVDNAIQELTGTYYQTPPIYSAIKVDGKKLYQYARENKEVEIKKRLVEVNSFQRISEINNNALDFEASVSSGTYIRSLTVDLADKLGEVAHLSKLVRTDICIYSMKDALDVENITINDVISDIEIFSGIKNSIILDDYMIKLVKNGVALDERQIVTDKPFLVYDKKSNLVAYYEVNGVNKYVVRYLF